MSVNRISFSRDVAGIMNLKWRRIPYTRALLPRVWRNGVRAVWSALLGVLLSVLGRRLGCSLRVIAVVLASFKLANTQKWSGQVNYA